MYTNVLLVAGVLLCIWMIYLICRPYTLDELLALDYSPEEEAKTLAAFSKKAKSRDDLEELWEYVFRFSKERELPNNATQFHHLLWLAYRFGEEDDFNLAVMVSEGCLYGLSYIEIMFPAQTFVDK